MQEIDSFVPANVHGPVKNFKSTVSVYDWLKIMEVNIKNLILLIELEQFEEDAKEISKTIRFVFKKK